MQITVRGSHELKLPAELGTLHLAARHESTDRSEAVGLTTRRASELRDAFERLTSPDASHASATKFAVDALSVWSWQPYVNGRRTATRHVANVGMRVTFRDFEVLGREAASWAELDGVSISGLDWSLSDETRESREDEVLAEAIRKASHRAQHMAATAGAGTVRCVQIADPGLLRGGVGGVEHAAAPAAFRAGLAAPAPGGQEPNAVEFSPEDIVLAATVHAVFEA